MSYLQLIHDAVFQFRIRHRGMFLESLLQRAEILPNLTFVLLEDEFDFTRLVIDFNLTGPLDALRKFQFVDEMLAVELDEYIDEIFFIGRVHFDLGIRIGFRVEDRSDGVHFLDPIESGRGWCCIGRGILLCRFIVVDLGLWQVF